MVKTRKYRFKNMKLYKKSVNKNNKKKKKTKKSKNTLRKNINLKKYSRRVKSGGIPFFKSKNLENNIQNISFPDTNNGFVFEAKSYVNLGSPNENFFIGRVLHSNNDEKNCFVGITLAQRDSQEKQQPEEPPLEEPLPKEPQQEESPPEEPPQEKDSQELDNILYCTREIKTKQRNTIISYNIDLKKVIRLEYQDIGKNKLLSITGYSNKNIISKHEKEVQHNIRFLIIRENIPILELIALKLLNIINNPNDMKHDYKEDLFNKINYLFYLIYILEQNYDHFYKYINALLNIYTSEKLSNIISFNLKNYKEPWLFNIIVELKKIDKIEDQNIAKFDELISFIKSNKIEFSSRPINMSEFLQDLEIILPYLILYYEYIDYTVIINNVNLLIKFYNQIKENKETKDKIITFTDELTFDGSVGSQIFKLMYNNRICIYGVLKDDNFYYYVDENYINDEITKREARIRQQQARQQQERQQQQQKRQQFLEGIKVKEASSWNIHPNLYLDYCCAPHVPRSGIGRAVKETCGSRICELYTPPY